MSTCDLGFEHADPEPEAVIVEAPDTEAPAEAAVEIARIEGDTAVKVAKIEARVADDELVLRLAELEGEVKGMRETLDRVAPAEPEPEPEPEPVIVEPEPAAPPPPADEHNAPKSKRRAGFF